MIFSKLLNLMRNSKGLFKNLWNERSGGRIRMYEEAISFGSKGGKKDKRLEKRPVDVFEEIISKKPQMNMKDLDSQIKIVKQRINDLSLHLRHVNLTQEKQALGYLQARKRYEKNKDKFKWAVTNRDLINKLCDKYKVRLVDIDNYYRNIPTEGVEEIKKFAQAQGKVNRLDPTFKLIIDDNGKETKKDPILLAVSPFGNWYYVLGAWDKEVEIVDDLIYKRR